MKSDLRIKAVRALFAVSSVLFLSFHGANLYAQGFGIFEAKGLSQGGATIALGSTDQAHFYNPALLSLHDGIEEKTKDGRVSFPVFSGQVSLVLDDLIDINDNEIDQALVDAIDLFNDALTPLTAGNAQLASQDLLDAVDLVNDENVSVDSFFGFSVSEPSDRQGGAFYLGLRAIGGGSPDIIDEDVALLTDYVEALQFIASGGVSGAQNSQIFNDDGTLPDPADVFDSTVEARGAAFLELGVSLSREFGIFGWPISVGATPKLRIGRTFEAVQSIDGNGIDTEADELSFQTFNADIGLATDITKNFRVGIAVKDVISESLDTALGSEVTIEPKTRLGVAYRSSRFELGIDYDLTVVEPVAVEAPVQEIAIGGGWQILKPIHLRLGYRHDMEGNREDIISGGVGFKIYSFLLDVTYATGAELQGAGLQMSYAF